MSRDERLAAGKAAVLVMTSGQRRQMMTYLRSLEGSRLDIKGNSAHQSNALIEVLNERDRQDAKWGTDDNHEPEIWLTILSEEVGELAECMLHKRFGGPEAKNLHTELVQVAAVAVKMLERGL